MWEMVGVRQKIKKVPSFIWEKFKLGRKKVPKVQSSRVYLRLKTNDSQSVPHHLVTLSHLLVSQ